MASNTGETQFPDFMSEARRAELTSQTPVPDTIVTSPTAGMGSAMGGRTTTAPIQRTTTPTATTGVTNPGDMSPEQTAATYSGTATERVPGVSAPVTRTSPKQTNATVTPPANYNPGIDRSDRYAMFQAAQGKDYDAAAAGIIGMNNKVSPEMRKALADIANRKAAAYNAFVATPKMDYTAADAGVDMGGVARATVENGDKVSGIGGSVPTPEQEQAIVRRQSAYNTEFARLNPMNFDKQTDTVDVINDSTAPVYQYDKDGNRVGLIRESQPRSTTKSTFDWQGNKIGEKSTPDESTMTPAQLTAYRAVKAPPVVNAWEGETQKTLQYNPDSGKYDIPLTKGGYKPSKGIGRSGSSAAEKNNAAMLKAIADIRKSEAKGDMEPEAADAAVEKIRADYGVEAKPQEAPPVKGARKAPDGKWYVSDPKRHGKYLEVR